MALTTGQESRRTARRNTDLLRRGIFIYSGGNVWRHWTASLPGHVRRTQGDQLQQWGPETGGGPFRSLLRTTKRLVQMVLAPPFWVRRSQADSFPIVIVSGNGDKVFLDPSQNRVAREFHTSPLPSSQAELRERFARHLRAPEFSVAKGGRILIEEYIRGRSLAGAEGVDQIRIVREVFGGYTSLVEEEALGRAADVLEPGLRFLDTNPAPSPLKPLFDDHELLDELGALPLVPTTGCGKSTNVMVAPDGSYRMIDCFPIGLWPFFYGPLFLLKSMTSSLECYWRGGFDSELERLFLAAGGVYTGTTQARQALLGLTFLARASRGKDDLRIGSPAEIARRLSSALFKAERVHSGGWWPGSTEGDG